jgi:hypothetical protein
LQIDIASFEALAKRGAIKQGAWGDGHERACLMSALVSGAKREEDCVAQGWPLWLAEIAVWLFDTAPKDEAVDKGRRLAVAIAAADKRGIDWDRVYCDVRTDAILPIALDAIGDGDESWRSRCRDVVQAAIDRGGRAPTDEEAAAAAAAGWAASAPMAASAPWAASAARSASAARAGCGARAAGAADAGDAGDAAEGDARDRIETALLDSMEGA